MAKKPKKSNTHGEKISADSLFTAPTVGSDSSVVNETAPTVETPIATNADSNSSVNTETLAPVDEPAPSNEPAGLDTAPLTVGNAPRGATPINPIGIHPALRSLNQWMLANGKVPSRISGGKLFNANAHDRANWMSFDKAVALANEHHCNLDVVFDNEVSPVCGVDIDHCIDEHGRLNQLAKDLVTQFRGRAYIEYSLSRTGLHFYFFDHDAPPVGTKKQFGESTVEVYSYKRAFIVTGNKFDHQPEDITFDGAVNLMLKFFGKVDRDIVHSVVKEAYDDGKLDAYLAQFRHHEANIDDDKLIERIRKSKAVSKFSKLFDLGDLSDFDGDHSRADFALVKILAFFTDNNVDQIKRIFAQSKLIREKWTTRQDYQERTIAAAIIMQSKLKTRSNVRPQFIWEIKQQLRKHNRSNIPVACAENYDLIFDYDLEIRNLLTFNVFSQKIELSRVPLWYSALQKQDCNIGFLDGDDASLQNYIDRTYDLRGDSVFRRIVLEYANRNMYHPVQDYFNSLPSWDGTPRAERLFIDYLGADDDQYTKAVTLKWLLAAVARVFHRGCKFDYTLILQGKQGIGKTTILSMLGGKWFGELDSIQGKDAVEGLQGKWLIELSEMQATKRAENEQIKSFLSRQIDYVRLPYERRSKPFPRQCVLAATTNDSEILRDQTGGRRFWFVECKAVDFDSRLLSLDIAQIWAEVYHLYNELFADGFDSSKLDIPVDLKERARELQSSNTDGSDLRGLISAFLDRPVPRYEFWQLLTKEERKHFFMGSVVYLPFNRIAASKVKLPDGVSHSDFLAETKDLCIDVGENGKEDKQMPLDPLGDKHYVGINRRDIFGDGKRMKVSPVEILNECFDGERSRLVSTRKIADIMRTLDGWQYQRGAVNDPHYGRQMCSFVRIEQPSEPSPGNELEHVDDIDIPF